MDQSLDGAGEKPPSEQQAKHNGVKLGVQGVSLKRFEEVLTRILPHVRPSYVSLPTLSEVLPKSATVQCYPPTADKGWPFVNLPSAARVLGKHPGQLNKPKRAARKEGQLKSLLRCILPFVPLDDKESTSDTVTCSIGNRFTIVDFGGGSGHLGIPLALLFPHCNVIVVDLQRRALDLMLEKAERVRTELNDHPIDGFPTNTCSGAKPEFVQDARFQCCGRDGLLENLYAFDGPVEAFSFRFDMALALHLCGEATDVTIRKAIDVGATAMIVAPCCVGKLSKKVSNPNVYHATGSNSATVSYPQSSTFCQLVTTQDDWDALAKAADYSNEQEAKTARNATRRIAKALLETDRRLFLEQNSYKTAMTRMDPWESTPKNDIIVAWKPSKAIPESLFSKLDKACDADLHVAESQLLPQQKPFGKSSGSNGPTCNEERMLSSDWTHIEAEEVQKQIRSFLSRTEDLENKMDEVFIFPTRMGGRKRKLIHFVAGKLDLAHWSVGEKDGDKTVAVARRGQRRRQNDEF
eukprot:Nitzschia sp. Nitz4//scaffold56_size114212//89218//90783//NITZ4_003963-RA/size114212-processed-gene-0.36-mRNA-1//-1//CDS//3329554745//5419//frame0